MKVLTNLKLIVATLLLPVLYQCTALQPAYAQEANQAKVSFVNNTWHISVSYDIPHIIALKLTNSPGTDDVLIYSRFGNSENPNNFVAFSDCFQISGNVSILKEECILQPGQYTLGSFHSESEIAQELGRNYSKVYLFDYTDSKIMGYNHPIIGFFPAGVSWWTTFEGEFKSGGVYEYY